MSNQHTNGERAAICFAFWLAAMLLFLGIVGCGSSGADYACGAPATVGFHPPEGGVTRGLASCGHIDIWALPGTPQSVHALIHEIGHLMGKGHTPHGYMRAVWDFSQHLYPAAPAPGDLAAPNQPITLYSDHPDVALAAAFWNAALGRKVVTVIP